MSAEASPRPWRLESDNLTLNPPVWFIVDANGAKVTGGFFLEADAALIVDAVNERAKFEEARMKFPDFRPVIIAAGQRDAAIEERDRLRDIVRRLTEYADAVTCYHPLTIEVVSSEHPARTFDGAALLREARAAIGEGETPKGKGVGR